jgi:hypothetical protein
LGEGFIEAGAPDADIADLKTLATDAFAALGFGEGGAGADFSIFAGATTIVDLAIAIIIETVAAFFTRGLCAKAILPLAILTKLDACCADAFVFGGSGAWIAGLAFAIFAEATFVDQAIAIVVQSVAADLNGGGLDRAFTRAKGTALADPNACDTKTRTIESSVG